MRPYGRAYEGAIVRLTRDKGVQLHECDSIAEAVALVRKLNGTVLLCHSSDNDEFVRQVTLLKLLAKQTRLRTCRVITTTSVKHESVVQTLTFYGATDALQEPVNEKALLFKLERQIRSVAQAKAKLARQKAKTEAADAPASSSEDRDAKQGLPDPRAASSRQESTGASARRPKLLRGEPIPVQSDFWLTDEVETKRIRDRWLLRLIGPSPDLGKWMRAPGAAARRGGRRLWQWIPNEPEGRALYKEPGEWFFRGQRPEFQEMEWLFVGADPELYFAHSEKPLASKFKTNDRGDLVVARDSPASAELLPLIRESLWSMNRKLRHLKPDEDETASDAEKGKQRRESGVAASDRLEEPEREVERELSFRLVDPLSMQADCWILHERKPKRVANRWVVKLMGPTPAHGRWVPATASETVWRWIPHDRDEDPFIREQGEWIFKGYGPKFQEDVWLFVADRPDLSFVHERSPKGAKLSTDDDGNLVVAQDSNQAKALKPLIRDSLRTILKGDGGRVAMEDTETEEAPAEAGEEPAANEDTGEYVFPAEPPETSGSGTSLEADPRPEQERGGETSAFSARATEPSTELEAVQEAVEGKELSITQEAAARPDESGTRIEKNETATAPSATQEAQSSKPEESAGIRAPRPPGPTLSPLTLAFLMSELVSDRKEDLRHAAKRYAAYVSASCGGLEVELWCRSTAGEWKRAAASESVRSSREEAARAGDPTGPARIVSKDTMVCAVRFGEEHCGAIVIAGKGADEVKLAYAQAVARIASGLLLSLAAARLEPEQESKAA
ncbi:MAG TPA: hypothetical protein VM598_10470 [Bdellovibrionota bacterium]|nr:hypothetical protein [Bdellovibrionota bacterium]